MTAVPHLGARRSARPVSSQRTHGRTRTGVMSGGAFTFGVLIVMSLGLMLLLALNTALTKGSFRVHELRVMSADLAGREQNLEVQIAQAESPATLSGKAISFGMVTAAAPAFIDLGQGRVRGESWPAGFATDTGAPTAAGIAPLPGQRTPEGVAPQAAPVAPATTDPAAAADEPTTDTAPAPAAVTPQTTTPELTAPDQSAGTEGEQPLGIVGN